MQTATERIKTLRKKLKFSAMAFTGSSGAAIAFIVGVAAQIPIIYVRKDDESCHGNRVECNTDKDIQRYLIVDDFISSGDTIRGIYDKIQARAREFNYKEPTCVGIYLYDAADSSYSSSTIKMNDNKVINIFTP